MCGPHRGSFAVRDHLRSNLGIISCPGIICGRGSFAALYIIHKIHSVVFFFLANPKVENLMKQLFHSRLLDMRLVIANSAIRASLAICHLISNARSWNNC